MKRVIPIITLLLALSPCMGFKAEAQQQPVRPKIGLVLSGGGAKGAAHIGVLQVLEEYGIRPDCIVGTSMGAIIGGLYAIGYSASEIDSLISCQNWDFIMSDDIPREASTFEKKQEDARYLVRVPFSTGIYGKSQPVREMDIVGPIPMEEPYKPGAIDRIPFGFINGQNIYNLFKSLSVGYQDSTDFNKMPIPFACVAVDLVTRQEVVFRNGYFVDAIRASMAIPGVFSPVNIGNMVLIDGGAKNNFPVDVARSIGADIVIGVKLGRPDERRSNEVNNFGDMFNSIYEMYAHEKYDAAIADTDILIMPAVKGFGTMDFDSASISALIRNGREAALEKSGELRKLKSYIDECREDMDDRLIGPRYVRVGRHKAVHLDRDTITLGRVAYEGIEGPAARMLLDKSQLVSGARLSGRDIEREIRRFYNTAAFKSVTYSLLGEQEPYDMKIVFEQGHNSELGLGFRVDTEEAAVVQLGVGINKHALYGSSFALSGKMSVNPKVSLTYTYSSNSNWRFNFDYDFRYSDPRLLRNTTETISFFSNKVRINASTQRLRSLYFELGAEAMTFNYSRLAADEASVQSYDWDAKRKNFAGAYGLINFNTLNDSYFATRGLYAGAGVNYYMDLIPDQSGFVAFNFHYSQAVGMGSHITLTPSLRNRTILGSDVPLAFMNVMGGAIEGRYMDQQMPFAGFNFAQSFRKILTSAEIEARINLTGRHYLTGTAAYAIDGDGTEDMFEDPGIIGAKAGYVYRSSVGPLGVYLNWSSMNHRVGFYAQFGYSF